MGPKLLLVSLVVLLLSGGALAVKRVTSTSTTNVAPTNADVQTLKQKSLAMQQQASQKTQERINAELAADEAQKADDVANAAVIAAKKDVDNAVTAKNIASTNVASAVKSVAKVKPARDAAQKSIDDKQAALDKAKNTLAAETKKGASLTGAAKTKQDGVIKSAQTAVNTAQANLDKARNDGKNAIDAYNLMLQAKADADAVLVEKTANVANAQKKQIDAELKLSDADQAVADAKKKVDDAKAAETQAYQWASKANDDYTTAYKAYTTAQSATSTTTTTTTTTTSSTTTSSSIVWNDGKYPGTGVTTCTAPLDIPCTDNCTDNSGLNGRYFVPNGGRCGTNLTPRCFGNAVLRRQCCAACTNSTACSFWQHYIPSSLSCSNCGICYLYKPTDAQPTCETRTVVVGGVTRTYANASTLGRPCPYTKHDPHFRGAHGTRFEFNGAPEKSYCLLTDSSLHVNMKMRGYYDTRTIGASLLRNGLAVRTWIRELGFVWSVDGVEHSFRLAARNGKSDKRDNGFLSLIEFDGRVLPSLEPGESYNLDGGLAFVFKGYEQEGGGFFDVDAYSLRIGDKLAMDIKLRPAHPLLQTPDDAQVHLNVNFKHVSRSPSVHGIMGQTYREGRAERAIDYAMLSRLLRTPFSADGDNGQGFLDGKSADYETSGVLSTDCGYSAFSK
ncbi:unnamed protein product [Closterium sp. Naga37s-1]|nr:unnamed protein product [Closterium sp. Naga37s-1]